jgi:hypothetical protein
VLPPSRSRGYASRPPGKRPPEGQFRPLSFRKTTHGELRPPIFDGDGTHGEDFANGELLAAHCAKALLFVVRFTAGPDAKACGWQPDDAGEIEYLALLKDGRYLGTITRQVPERFCSFGLEKVLVLDGLGHGPGGGGRRQATFFGNRFMPKYQGGVPLTVALYFGLDWLGRWKEIVIQVPKKTLYVARV